VSCSLRPVWGTPLSIFNSLILFCPSSPSVSLWLDGKVLFHLQYHLQLLLALLHVDSPMICCFFVLALTLIPQALARLT
jgi:hypothetical protein